MQNTGKQTKTRLCQAVATWSLMHIFIVFNPQYT